MMSEDETKTHINPQKLYLFRNADKDGWVQDEKNRQQNENSFKRSGKYIVLGAPQHGKSNLILNMITNSDFDKIYIYKKKNTKEYNTVPHVMITKISHFPFDEMNDNEKALFILEDFSKSNLKDKDDMEAIETLCSYTASHHGLTLVVVCQDYFSCPLSVRRRMTHFILFPNSVDLRYTLPSISGIPKAQKDALEYHYFKNRNNKYDFYSIDITEDIDKKFKFNMEPLDLTQIDQNEIRDFKKKIYKK